MPLQLRRASMSLPARVCPSRPAEAAVVSRLRLPSAAAEAAEAADLSGLASPMTVAEAAEVAEAEAMSL